MMPSMRIDKGLDYGSLRTFLLAEDDDGQRIRRVLARLFTEHAAAAATELPDEDRRRLTVAGLMDRGRLTRLGKAVAYGLMEHEFAAHGGAEDFFGDVTLAGRRVLDFGCGAGVYSLAAWRRGATSVLAVDANARQVDAARLLWGDTPEGLRFAVIPAEPPFPLPSSGFDVVLARLVFPYVDPDAALAGLVRTLTPGGTLLILLHARRFYRDNVIVALRARSMAMAGYAAYGYLSGWIARCTGHAPVMTYAGRRIRDAWYAEEWLRERAVRHGFEVRNSSFPPGAGLARMTLVRAARGY